MSLARRGRHLRLSPERNPGDAVYRAANNSNVRPAMRDVDEIAFQLLWLYGKLRAAPNTEMRQAIKAEIDTRLAELANRHTMRHADNDNDEDTRREA